MSDVEFFNSKEGRRIAFVRREGAGPGVVFLGGFRSDMTGTKAMHLQNWAEAKGRAFLRFDYSGHGQSSGDFLDGCIGEWAEDAVAAVSELTRGHQILVGSSMGGWISLILARRLPERIAGIVAIAPAPDFTEDSMWNGFSPAQRAELSERGYVELPSDYSDEPYVITKKLIEDGRNQLVLRQPLDLPGPLHMLHGTDDTDVAMSVPLRILEVARHDDVRLSFLQGSDHRFSGPKELALITRTIEELEV